MKKTYRSEKNNQLHGKQTRFKKSDAIETELLYLIPLVQIAWAHGAISPRERQLIFEAARAEGIDERNLLNNRLADLLINQPSRQFFDKNLDLINQVLQQMTVKEREQRKSKIFDLCTRVAAAAGGKSLMDINHHISIEERETLAEISEKINYHPNIGIFI